MNRKSILASIFITVVVFGILNTGLNLWPLSVSAEGINNVPIVSSPDDVFYYYGDTGNTITWEIADDNPAYWIVLLDGSLYDSNSWDLSNESVIVDIDGFDVGAYEFTILVSDDVYNVSDTVFLTVLYNDLTPLSSFSISSNTQWESIASSEIWSGNGTETNPYIIEHYLFDVASSGILIMDTDVYFIIQNCTFVSDSQDWTIGVNLQWMSNGAIHNCTFVHLWVGTIVYGVANISWVENQFSSVSYGIKMQDSLSCELILNDFYSGGVGINGYALENWDHYFYMNEVNGKTLGFFNGLTSVHIYGNDYGQIILANSTNTWIEGGAFHDVGSAVQIGLSFNCMVWASEMVDCSSAIYVERSDTTLVSDCIAKQNREFGIQINESADCVILSSNITGAGYSGILALASFNTTLFGNAISGCNDIAVAIFESEYSVIHSNYIEHNSYIGLEMGDCSHSWITENHVKYNLDKGIYIAWGEYVSIYGNEIGYNGAENAYDDGANNEWDDGNSIGNMWSDYGGTGYYYIPGSAGSIDHYPMSIGESPGPSINHPPDFSYLVNTTGHYITWLPSSDNPNYYAVYKDGGYYTWDFWDGGPINVNVDGLPIGTHAFTIDVADNSYHNATDIVIVTVFLENGTTVTTTTTTTTTTTSSNTTTSSTTNSTLDVGTIQQITLIVSAGSIVVIIVIIVLISRHKSGMG